MRFKKMNRISIFIFLLPFMVFSQQDSESDKKESKDKLSVFVGGISSVEATAFAVGLDYQHRFNKIVGFGALADYASGDFNSVLTCVALYLHAGDVEFTIAPGVEFSEEIDLSARLGVAYEIELKRFSISPSVFYDMVRNEKPAWVYGLSFSFDL
jgi:O-glycosyl hydrolase